MSSNAPTNFEDFLNPVVMRGRLLSASIFIAIFESMKDAIVERIRTFFTIGWSSTGDTIDPKYHTEVLNRNRSPVYASLDWLKEHKVVGDADIQVFSAVKDHRNKLAHQLLSVLGMEGLPAETQTRFDEMVNLLHKIELWWIKNVEIPVNSDFDGMDVNDDEIVPGRILAVRLLCDIALGDAETSSVYYNEFVKRAKAGATLNDSSSNKSASGDHDAHARTCEQACVGNNASNMPAEDPHPIPLPSTGEGTGRRYFLPSIRSSESLV